MRSGRRQTGRRIRDPEYLRKSACEQDVRAGARAPGRRQIESRMRDGKDLRKGA